MTRGHCPGCGWTSKPMTAARAAYALRRHSCDRWRRLAERDERMRQRAAGGTPVACSHPKAGHVHGTHAAYVLDRCRCRPCMDADADYERNRARQIAYGRWQAYVPAEPARAHLRALSAQGLGYKRIAALYGLNTSTLGALLHGKRRSNGQVTAIRRIRPDMETRILAVHAGVDNLGARIPVDGAGTRRRLQALVAVGWSMSELSRRLGMLPSNGIRVFTADQVAVTTFHKTRALYEQLWDAAPPAGSHRERISVSRARNFAVARGWVPPLAWDDDTIDDPAAVPQGAVEAGSPGVDEVAVLRRITGDLVPLTRAERWVAVQRLHAQGLSDNAIAGRLHVSDRQVLRDRQSLGLPAVVAA